MGIINWFREVASQLTKTLGNSTATANPLRATLGNSQISLEELNLDKTAYLEFLVAVLQATSDSDAHQLLVANLDKLNDNLVQVLKAWATSTLAENPEQAQSIAAAIGNFSNRIQQFPLGSRSSSLEIAIAGYEVVLGVFTREAFPQDWATVQNNLGNAYSDRLQGEKAQNLEQAIHCYQAALQVCTREAFPQDWAMTQNNLGTAYSNRLQGEKAQNLEQAIHCYQAALQVRTREAFPQDWAMTQNNLGNAYSDRLQGEKAQNLEQAIHCYQAALQVLQVYTREAFPQDWALTQENLAYVYLDRKQISEAIRCLCLALKVLTPTSFPLNCLKAGRNLGQAAAAISDWATAIFGYDNAIQAVEQSRAWALSETGKQKILTDAIDVYERIVFACLQTQQPDKAIEYIERSKARNLVELLANRNLHPKGEIPQDILQELTQLRQEIPALQRQLEETTNTKTETSSQTVNREATHSNQIRASLTSSQQQLTAVLEQIKLYDPDFSLTQKVKPIQFTEIQSLLDRNTAILEWYITDECFYAFVITSDLPPLPWQSSSDDRKALETWATTYHNNYTTQKDNWRQDLNNQLAALSNILHLNDIISRLPSQITQLILIPHRWLHLFPLHALPLTSNGTENTLLDKFSNGVRYAPSCQLLQLSQKRQLPSPSQSLFAIQNPTGDLDYADIEVQEIQSQFNPANILAKSNATKTAFTQAAALKTAYFAHFACHGSFNFAEPLKSALLLTDAISPAANQVSEQQQTEYLSWRVGQPAQLPPRHPLRLRNRLKHVRQPQR